MATRGLENFEGAPTITTLGSAGIITPMPDGQSATIGPGKPLALLVYLTASPGRAATREHLIDLLWADAEPDAARHGVRQTVWFLRHKIVPDIISATREAVRLTAEIETDRDRFLRAIEAQNYDEAIAIYRGDFLPNMAMPGGLRFEQWADVERQRLRSMFLRAGETVARSCLAQGRHRDAIALARRLRNADRAAEASWRLLIEALLSANDHVGATTEADALTRYLATEQRGAEPATQAMIRAAQSSSPAASVGSKARGLTPELIGRAEEFAVLTSAWEDARAGRAVHVHISALPGVGKTRLVGDFAARLRSRRARVALLSLRPGDYAIPYAALGELAAVLAQLPGVAGISPPSARTLVALHPALSMVYNAEPDNSQSHDAALRRAVAIHELIVAVSDDAPLAIIVDDLHWIDESSDRALTSALQRLGSQRVLVVTAARPNQTALRTPGTIQVWLRPLSEAHVGDLVTSLGALPDEPWADWFATRLHAATDGVPLLVLEMLQLLVERGVLKLVDSVWSSLQPELLGQMLWTRTALGDRLRALSAAERRALTTVAAAGTPLPAQTLSELLDMSRAEVDAHVSGLEQRGFVVADDEGVRVTHDVIAEVAINLVPSYELEELHRELGARFFGRAGSDAGQRLRAASHFARAGDVEALTRCFVHWLALVRRRGDSRSTTELAAEFTIEQPSLLESAALARAVPLHLRIGQRQRLGVMVASLVVLASAIAFALRTTVAAEPPDATLFASSADSRGHVTAATIELRQSDLGRTDVIELQRGRSARPIAPADPMNTVLSPDGQTWASKRVFADSGGLDLVLTDARSGAERRLTYSPGDDYAPSWSPDGKFLVFSTARLSPRGHPDLAIVNVKSGEVRELTHGPESDETPQWHPSGTEIAFMRRDWTTGHFKLCLITIDAARSDCGIYESAGAFVLRGWYDWHRVIVLASLAAVSDSAILAIVDVQSHEFRPVLSGRIDAAQTSPDGQWVACHWAANPQVPLRWVVFPVARPDLAREIVADRLGERGLTLLWLGRRRSYGYVTKLVVKTPLDVLPLVVGSELSVSALDDSGRAVNAIPVSWASLTPTVATIDSTSGILMPRTAGAARIHVSAGGWLTADTTVRFADGAAAIALTEDWSKGLKARFVPFGVPLPAIVASTRIGPAMRNNGDGSFTSGVYSRAEFIGRAGLGVEATVSTPIDSLQWQVLSLSFQPGMDSARLSKWDHRDSAMPGTEDSPTVARCITTIPAAEGQQYVRIASLADVRRELHGLPAAYFSGRPYRLRMQLFPDGRCGLAVDGKPLMIAPGLPLSDARYRLVIAGNSAQTDILVGALEVWTGVRTDIDWLELDNAAARKDAP